MNYEVEVKCEKTGEKIRFVDGFLICNTNTGEWQFVCAEAEQNPAEYYIPVKEMLSSDWEFIDWMAHISEKTWFDPQKWFDFFRRLRINVWSTRENP